MSNPRLFCVSDVTFEAEGTEEQLSSFLPLLDSAFLLDPGPQSASAHPDIRIRLTSGDSGAGSNCRGELLHRSEGLRIWALAAGFELAAGETRVVVDEEGRLAEFRLQEGFGAIPLQQQRELLLLSFLMLLRGQGRFGLHANAVASEQRQALIVGPSGSGKTSLSLCFISQGWRYVSDDASLLRAVDDRIDVCAFRRGFSCPPSAVQQIRQLERQDGVALPGGKRLVDLVDRIPDQFVYHLTPDLLLFPQVVAADRSVLTPCSAAQAMAALMEQSPGIMTGVAVARRQMAALAQLVRQTSSYRIDLGRDVFDDPQRLVRIVEQLDA